MIVKTVLFGLMMTSQIFAVNVGSMKFAQAEEVPLTKTADLTAFRRRFENVGIILPAEDTDSSAVRFSIPNDAENVPESGPINVALPSIDDGLPEEEKPAFCNDLDCPKFKVVKKYNGYEERMYLKSGWVSTSLAKIYLDSATKMMFMKLFDYIQGNNDAKEKIAMTAPVITSIIRGQGPACVNNFTMSFFMTDQSPPNPSDDTVFLSTLPTQRVFVRSFGGFADEKKWLENAEKLAKDLSRDKQSFNAKYFYTAGYDSPFRILDRHNEIWYLAKE